MLLNPNWNKTAKDVSLNDFIGWLETKDPAEGYDYQNKCGECCIGQYMAARGIHWPAYGWEDTYKRICTKIFGDWCGPPQMVLAGSFSNRIKDRTFGEVLKRTIDFKEKCHV